MAKTVPVKIAFIGAGSIGFTRTLLRDLCTVPELRDLEVAFTDIDERNLQMVTQLCQRDLDHNGLRVSIKSTTDRRLALAGAKYVFCVARIGGLEAFQTDIELPLRYGVDQCVGDTLCPGGIMYGQRGVAAMLDFCKDIREMCVPGCKLFNYSNPMAMLTWAANQYGGVEAYGLCHGVEHGHAQIAEALGLDKAEVDFTAAGINHQTWYLRVSRKGVDLTSSMLAAFERHPVFSNTERVRIDVLRRFGFYSTESNGHLSEYLPWYRKRADQIKNWIDLGCWINGETGGYLRVCTEGRDWFQTEFPKWLSDPPYDFAPTQRSSERGSYIIEALETGRVFRGYFNVVNRGIISNLPNDAIVEVPGYADANGINLPLVGDLPLGCAAICNASISVQRLAVEAAVTGNDQLLRQAMLLDPLTSAVCDPPEVWQMVDEMLVAQRQWLPQYQAAASAAEARLAKEQGVPTRDWRGAARLSVRTPAELRADPLAATEIASNPDKAKTRAAASLGS